MAKLLSKDYVVKTLSEIYILDGLDVFNYELSKKNYSSYHHIIKKEDLKLLGFPVNPTLENGIILSIDGHSYLHEIERNAPDIFYHLNKIILLITKEYRLPTMDERSLMQILLEAYEYRMYESYNYLVAPRYLTRKKIS